MTEKLEYESCISQIPTSFATCSIGSPDTPLPQRLRAISNAGFTGIELSFPDILSYGHELYGREVKEDEYQQLCQVAKEIKNFCEEVGLQILMLQPFSNFEGWPTGSNEREDAGKRAAGWIEIMRAAGTKMLQVRLEIE
jgi:sugar phosphate isomerase/epimerase